MLNTCLLAYKKEFFMFQQVYFTESMRSGSRSRLLLIMRKFLTFIRVSVRKGQIHDSYAEYVGLPLIVLVVTSPFCIFSLKFKFFD